jgi:hypothetical protein
MNTSVNSPKQENQPQIDLDEVLEGLTTGVQDFKTGKRNKFVISNPEDEVDQKYRLLKERRESESSMRRMDRTHCFMLVVGFLIFVLFAGLIVYYATSCGGNERMVEKIMGYLIGTSAAILSYLAGTKK